MPSQHRPSPRRAPFRTVAFLLLAGLLFPLAKGFAEDEDRVKGADWIFWYQDGGNLYDEAYLTKQDCEKTAKTWNQESPRTPIVFPCAKISRNLLAQARKRCKKNEKLTCQWAKKIEMDLKEPEEEKEGH